VGRRINRPRVQAARACLRRVYARARARACLIRDSRKLSRDPKAAPDPCRSVEILTSLPEISTVKRLSLIRLITGKGPE